MPHAVLLGDSIFDNGVYVPDGPAVIDQLCAALPEGWKVSLLAVDGHATADVESQLAGLPDDATHLIVSCGGNDALNCLPILAEGVGSVGEALSRLAQIRLDFIDNPRAKKVRRRLTRHRRQGLAVIRLAAAPLSCSTLPSKVNF